MTIFEHLKAELFYKIINNLFFDEWAISFIVVCSEVSRNNKLSEQDQDQLNFAQPYVKKSYICFPKCIFDCIMEIGNRDRMEQK